MPAELANATVVLFPIDKVIVPPSRQRQKAEADQTLLASIEQHGLLNPILCHADGTLVAGERRLDAHKKLKLTTIRATVLESLSPALAFKLELAENLARKQLSWQEETRAVGEYHAMRLAAFGGWTAQGTATDLGLSNATVSRYLAVARELGDEDIQSCPTFTGAFNLISSRAERARIAATSRGLDAATAATFALPPAIPIGASKEERTRILVQNLDVNQAAFKAADTVDEALANIEAGKVAEAALRAQHAKEQSDDLVLCADFTEWVPDYRGHRFDVLHVDFPYGIAYKGARTRRTGKSHIAPVYNDDPDIFFALVDCLLEHQDNIAFPAAHCIFWFDMRFYAWTVEQFTAAGWVLVQPHPLIWTKGYQGIASDVRRRPRHCYETALLFSRGDRKLSRIDKDHFEAAVDEKLHLNQKPVSMLKHFLSLVCDEHSAVLDPTCGSGSALVAASQLRAARFLGLELDPANADVARFLLQRHNVKASDNDDSTSTNLEHVQPAKSADPG